MVRVLGWDDDYFASREKIEPRSLTAKSHEFGLQPTSRLYVAQPHDPIVNVPASKNLRKEVRDLFGANEAARSQMLLERRFSNANGYVVGVSPPSIDEIKETRRKITGFMNQLSGAEKQKFDQWLQETIRKYDPFGVTGNKIISIRIPDSPQESLIAKSYSIDNFQEEVKIIEHQSHIPRKLKNLIIYSAEPGGDLHRFKSLIQQPDEQTPGE
jgi:hypothetical protein